MSLPLLGIPSLAACRYICIWSRRNHVSSLQKSVKPSFRDPENTTNQARHVASRERSASESELNARDRRCHVEVSDNYPLLVLIKPWYEEL